MSTYRPSRKAYLAAIPAVVISAFGVVEGISLYVHHNAVQCGGGLGWIGPGLTLYATLACALLATLGAFVYALVAALRGRRWAWSVGLIAAAALGTLVTIKAETAVSHMLVGYTLGFGCSWFYSDVARSLVPLLVAAPTLGFLFFARRRA
jgi:hypothetical protein